VNEPLIDTFDKLNAFLGGKKMNLFFGHFTLIYLAQNSKEEHAIQFVPA